MPLTGGAAADAGRLPGRDTSPGEPGRAGTAGPAGSTDDAGADLGRQGSVLTVPGRAEPLRLGSLTTPAPVALSPMAGVTNAPYRALCRWFGPGLFVAEMVSAQALVQRNPKAYRLLEQWPGERPRSVQLFGTDPAVVGQAAELIGR
ncbi:MAG: tRNA-dihydrouridine synthase, partial [Bifidobacteriaceae bacterium]|nr:tRNA-dihydrouridine synthase [Bifidobacteriaceae bacterium]